MATQDHDLSSGMATLTAALQRTVEAHAAEADELAALCRVTLEAVQQSLGLHRSTLETLRSVRREIERLKRSLKALGTSRS